MKLIVGLGNKGRKYKNTRHNIGFEVVDKISEELKVSFKEGKGEYLIAKGYYGENDVLLLKPHTYMNNSGIAVVDAINRYKISYEDLLVLCDDLNVPLGKIRFRRKGQDGGNKGLQSIIYHIESVDFPRLRIGIKNENLTDDYEYFVLSEFAKDEVKKAGQIIDVSAEASLYWVEFGIDKTMNKFNNIVVE